MEEYEINEAFHNFVDAYCKKHEISVETALTHALVKEVGAAYKETRLEGEKAGDGSKTDIRCGC